jgi:hypothetical protein
MNRRNFLGGITGLIGTGVATPFTVGARIDEDGDVVREVPLTTGNRGIQLDLSWRDITNHESKYFNSPTAELHLAHRIFGKIWYQPEQRFSISRDLFPNHPALAIRPAHYVTACQDAFICEKGLHWREAYPRHKNTIEEAILWVENAARKALTEELERIGVETRIIIDRKAINNLPTIEKENKI